MPPLAPYVSGRVSGWRPRHRQLKPSRSKQTTPPRHPPAGAAARRASRPPRRRPRWKRTRILRRARPVMAKATRTAMRMALVRAVGVVVVAVAVARRSPLMVKRTPSPMARLRPVRTLPLRRTVALTARAARTVMRMVTRMLNPVKTTTSRGRGRRVGAVAAAVRGPVARVPQVVRAPRPMTSCRGRPDFRPSASGAASRAMASAVVR